MCKTLLISLQKGMYGCDSTYTIIFYISDFLQTDSPFKNCKGT